MSNPIVTEEEILELMCDPPTTGLDLMEWDQRASWDRRDLTQMAHAVLALLAPTRQPWPGQLSAVRARIQITMAGLDLRDREG